MGKPRLRPAVMGITLFALALSGTSCLAEEQQADCDARIRWNETTYVAQTITESTPERRIGRADALPCRDDGGHHGQSPVTNAEDDAEVWSFRGHDASDVVAVPVSESWQVFISTELSTTEVDKILASFARSGAD